MATADHKDQIRSPNQVSNKNSFTKLQRFSFIYPKKTQSKAQQRWYAPQHVRQLHLNSFHLERTLNFACDNQTTTTLLYHGGGNLYHIIDYFT